jgi:hypothetical protein
MKKICFGLFIFFAAQIIGIVTNGQKMTADARISEVYVTYVKDLNKDQLAWINNQLFRSEIRKEPLSKDEKYPLLSSVPLVNKYNPQIMKDDFSKPLQINPIKYQINFMETKDQAFRIDGTDYILFVKGKQ